MEATYSNSKSGGRNHYYRCSRRRNHGKEACANGRGLSVRGVESAVWDFVRSLLEDPERLRCGIERLLEREGRLLGADAVGEERRTWEQTLEQVERKRSRLQDMAAEGLITFAELGTKLEALEEGRREAVRRLEELGRLEERFEALRQGTQNLVDSYTQLVPEVMEVLPSETRHRIYKILDLTVAARPDGELLASMVFAEDPKSCTRELASSYPRTPYLP